MDCVEQNRIINEVLDGDVNAYGQLVREFQTPIYNLMYRVARSEHLAMEMTQETFTRAYQKLERFNPGRSFFSWLYAIGSNLAKDYQRKSGREVYFCDTGMDENNLVDCDLNQADCLERKLELSHVIELVHSLPFDNREALLLRYQKDLSMREVAQALSISVGAAKMRVQRALKALRIMVNEEKN